MAIGFRPLPLSTSGFVPAWAFNSNIQVGTGTYMYRKNVAGQFLCVQMLLTASGAVATGLTPTVRRCIDGTFAAGGGTVTEDGTTGSYKYAMTQADSNGNDISFIFTATGAIPVCVNIITTAADPTDVVRLGLTALPNVASGSAGAIPTTGTGSNQISVSSGQVASNIKKVNDITVNGSGTSVDPWGP